MRLSKIKLSGFKSFVDPTTISFPGNLMGIVGPNGCGKSNIIYAIRWVLGESSAKTLRGDSMADVIFNGSSGRKPVGQASIELIFDNSDGQAGGAYASYSEISVRRTVTRDGTSQYFLNSGRCRRKDITHLLLGTGLGSHGYSIIEQGMISRLVEARPEELRAFLEEAAGISKYKDRRRETDHRIRHTRDNLERLEDLRDEVAKQLTHLQRQARAAERYKELKSESRLKTAELLVLRLQGLKAELGQLDGEYRQRQLKLDSAVTEQRSAESAIEQLRVAQGETGEAFNAVQGDYYRVGAEIARLEQVIKHRKETSQRMREELATTEQQLAEIQGHIQSDQVELQQLELLISELSPDLDRAIGEQRRADNELRDAETAMEQWRQQHDHVATSTAEIERTIHVEETRLEQLAVRKERLAKEEDALLAERAGIESAQAERRLETLVANEEQLRSACSDANRALDAVTSQINEHRERERALSARLDQIRAGLQNDRGRLASLEALQEAALGKVSEQVTGWFEAHAIDQSPRLAESLDVEHGWERAVEMVLGNFLQAVSIRSFDTLQESLGSLGNSGFTLVSDETAIGRREPTEEHGARLADYVKSPGSARGLLQGVHTASDLGGALVMRSSLSPDESVITRDGFWIGPNWLRISSGDDPRMGVIARGDEIESLREAVAEATTAAGDAERMLADTRERVEHLEKVRETTQRESNRRQQMYAEVCTRLTACRNELRQQRERSTALEARIDGLATERESLHAAERQSRAHLETSAANLEGLTGQRAALEGERDALQGRLATARSRAQEAGKQAQAIAIQVESRRSSRESATAALERVQTQRQHLLQRQAEIVSKIEEADAPIEGDDAALSSLLDEHAVAEQKLGDARKDVESIDAQLREAEQSRNERAQNVSQARESVDEVRLALREVQVRADTVSEQFDQTEFDLETVTAGLTDEATIESWAEAIEGLDRRIQRLGAINLAAIDEFQEQSERKEYLDKQFEDLTEALQTLENAIRKIDRETRSKFRDTFEKANEGIARLFPRLFGGGNAYLELDSDDLLSCGVTVMARPPGKRISTIHLLSGGEKALTAVALVFSIFELNPAPFCLLDEVDAPLDEANVGRFSEILHEMSERVQFVIITHNKTTMESMGQLAGVTMQEPGVSRMVAVDIDEAVQVAAM